MRAHRQIIDTVSVENRNYQWKDRIRHMADMVAKLTADQDRHIRRADCLCPYCYYEKSRIGGATATYRQCAYCDDDVSNGNTNVDVLCRNCSKQAGLCRHCGADLNYVNRRSRNWPEQLPPHAEKEWPECE